MVAEIAESLAELAESLGELAESLEGAESVNALPCGPEAKLLCKATTSTGLEAKLL